MSMKGEKYSSPQAEAMHEKGESASERRMEYGPSSKTVSAGKGSPERSVDSVKFAGKTMKGSQTWGIK